MAWYEVLASQLEGLTKKIDRIIRKCVKEGISYTYDVSDPYEKKIEVKKCTYAVKYVKINIECFFKRNGWQVLGSVSRQTGIIQCYFDNPELIKEYHNTDFHCDHCHKNVYRNSVVLLENEQGERKLVGSSCVKEFTRGLDGDLYVSYAALMSDLNSASEDAENIDDSFFERGNVGLQLYDTHRVVSCASSLIRQYGFTSSRAYEDDPNAIPTKFYISDTLDHYSREVTDDDEQLASKAIEWCANLPEDEIFKSSYLFNLNQLCKNEHCTYYHFGLLASLIPAYQKEQSMQIKKAERQKSEYVGQVKDKLNLTVQLVASPSYDSAYGTCYIYIMKDESGNIFVWKTNKYVKYEIGSILNVKGTVKEHSEYRDEKQTVLTRCSVSLFKEVVHEEASNKVEEAMTEFMANVG